MSTPEQPPSNAAPQAAALGQAAGRGFSWLTLSLVSGKEFSFLAQLVLGALLLEEDFERYRYSSKC